MSECERDFRFYGCTMIGYGEGTWFMPPPLRTIIPRKQRYLCEHCLTIMQIDADYSGKIRCQHCGAPVKPYEEVISGKKATELPIESLP